MKYHQVHIFREETLNYELNTSPIVLILPHVTELKTPLKIFKSARLIIANSLKFIGAQVFEGAFVEKVICNKLE